MAVVDVTVIMQLQFQQSFVEYVEVPQTQFSDRVVDSVASQRHVRSADCQSPLRSHRCSSWIGWDTPVVVQRQARMVQTAQSGGAAGAIPAVLDVPVIMQRRWVSRQLRCHRFRSSPESVDISVRTEMGILSVGMALMNGLFGIF